MVPSTGSTLRLLLFFTVSAAMLVESITLPDQPTKGKREDVTIFLNGEPKSGTSWLELVAHNLAKEACTSQWNNGCTFTQRARDFQIVFDRGEVAMFRYSMPSKHNMYPQCAERSKNGGYHHAPSITAQCKKETGTISCPCWLHAPALNASLHTLHTHRDALARCAARVFKPGNECHGDSSAKTVQRYLLMVREPRDVAVSEHFYKVRKYSHLQTRLSVRMPLLTSWIALRYFLAEQYNAHKPELQKERSAALHAAPVPFLVVMYSELKRSLDPYRQVCRLLGFSDCNDKILRAVKDKKSAETMLALAKPTENIDHDGRHADVPPLTAEERMEAKEVLARSKLRSGGAKSLLDYGLEIDFLTAMARYSEEVLPTTLVARLKAHSDDWVAHTIKHEQIL
jgi:hypothetical protein